MLCFLFWVLITWVCTYNLCSFSLCISLIFLKKGLFRNKNAWYLLGVLGSFWCVCLCSCMCMCAYLLAQSCPTLLAPWTVAHQAPPSVGFPRQEYWSGVPFPPPGDLLNRNWTYVSCISCIGRLILYHQCHLKAHENTFVAEGRLNFVRQPIGLSFALYTFYNYIFERTFHVDYCPYTITI